jgi:nitronate monooxygenase
MQTWPVIIQGGMGIGVSNWTLARAVSQLGQLGVVSATSINSVFVRRLQDGDRGGHLKRACENFPFKKVASRIYQEFFVEGGKNPKTPYKRLPMFTAKPTKESLQVMTLASFCEVFLAKENHNGKVGVNLLEKLQMYNLSAIYGAMLAKVDSVLMGAGIPREIPGCLDQFVKKEKASMKLNVINEKPEHSTRVEMNPAEVFETNDLPELRRPDFFPIISSNTLANHLLKKATGKIDGFIIEGSTAGGHNAPPRGAYKLNERGEPVYGERDQVELSKIKELGIPFWLAGSYGSPEKLKSAIAEGAEGIQVGSAFAFCEESGFSDAIKQKVIDSWVFSKANPEPVLTDPRVSPTDFPFKVVPVSETLSEKTQYLSRPRKCDLGYLRQAYAREDGSLGYRCASEPTETYLKKGGTVEDTEGRKCLCNALMVNINQGQVQESGYEELPLVTAGDDLKSLKNYIQPGKKTYTAADVIDFLLSKVNFRIVSKRPFDQEVNQ